VIEIAMKQGRLAFPWRIIRSWVKPAVPPLGAPHDATVIEFPLKLIAPLFLSELRTKLQKKIVLDESIPNLFSGGPEAEVAPVIPAVVVAPAPKYPAAPVAAPAPKPADTNYFAKNADEAVEEVAPVVKKGPTPGTAFLVRYATPNEIISKAAALDGVEGALIALPDGLLVASHIPQSMNADTVAAFLPQIFGRVSQCTKELRLGELNNLHFTVGTTPWKIFKVGAIYFAAFGRAGEPLPSAQLAGIAAELDRKAK
jgi:predicted regulator of Ras-like GTPase activity (Roadblock/LC7/MglB family)